MKPLPSSEFLHECFSYNRKTGELIWRVRPEHHFAGPQWALMQNAKFAGKSAGSLVHGHLYVYLLGGNYYVHRIIWKMVTGEDPGKLQVDHRNTIRHDNRWRNLRLADVDQQMHNASLKSNNVSGVKGVSWNSARKKWFAQIRAHGVHYSLGYFSDIEKAARVVERKRKELHEDFANNGRAT